jgi:hypothetical protein
VLLCLASVPAVAQEPANDAESSVPSAPPPTAEPPSAVPPPAPQEAKSSTPPSTDPGGWHMELSGYFRAPMALGISSRPAPDSADPDMNSPTYRKLIGAPHLQVAYGPNRTVDANYFSFAYTRLQEQDWAEFFIHAKKKHVDAALGWMGYWYQGAGFRNPDAGWGPGLAYISLDTDAEVAGLNTNIRGTAGAFWPSFGYMEVYDTYTLGRFRQMGGQLQWTLPGIFNPDATVVLTGGFGTARDGSFNYGSPPFFGGIVALDLLTYWNAEIKYSDRIDVGIHYNTEWTADPNLSMGGTPGDKSYGQVQAAHLTVLGGQLTLHAPMLGRLWLSPSLISVRNGWALASAGTEVMHSLGGVGIATNYLGWQGSPSASTGSGRMINFGFVYENTLSEVQGLSRGMTPDLKLSIFGLLAAANLDLPPAMMGIVQPQKTINQLKYGVALTYQANPWLGYMLRYDGVNYDLDHPGYVFASITPRIYVQTHFLSSERIYLQYSRYFYGDKMVLAGQWPWGEDLVDGSHVLQQGPYAGTKGDANVVKMQADIAF